MTTSRNEETAAASEPEAHATSEAATGETSVRAARAASAGGGSTAGAAEPSTAPGESAGQAPKKPGEASAETSEAAAEPGRKHEQEEETANGAPTTTATAAEGGTATAEADAESDAEAEATATMTATTTADAPERTGRPNKAVLAGAAIAGVLLVAVPFLVHAGGGNDGKRSAGGGEAPGTLLGSGKGDIPGAFASAAPSPRKPNGKGASGGKDGENTDGGDPSPDGAHGSTPLNEGGGSTGGTTAGGDSSTRKSGGGTKTTAGKTTTDKKGTGTGSAAGGAAGGSGGTTEKAAPQSTVVYTGVAGPGCPTPAGGGYQQDGYFSEGSAGWYTRPSGGWSGNGCNGRYVSVPMSGDTGVDAKSRVKWWWKPGTGARTCQISVYIPNISNSLYVGGHPTKYHVLVNANDRTSMYSSFTINQVAHRGQWVDAGTFALKGSTIGVKLLDRGDDWSKGWEKAHHAAAQIRATCRS
ncbi:hypothetical protein OOK13_34305 [Streptomyces sp. NBC_00378]|uniref:hypothetical protein n=1 Tax=unclassified Streptomyces TaxID=2593676 RepID=UPI0022588D22|nr:MULTISPECIES: hypothetical protein [unclassified Streptomyces]MCX5113442.1 hypothetical protein [Streptomyces sp. NBC_00378]